MADSTFLRNVAITGAFLISNPREFFFVPRWLRERNDSMMELRQPWWPYGMANYVNSILPPEPCVFEYGGGGSSIWLADRGAVLTIIEHDQNWVLQLRRALPRNADVTFIPPQEIGVIGSAAHNAYFDSYVQAIDNYPDESFDLVVIDGRARVDCVTHARSKVKRGGLLLLDDSDRSRYKDAREAMASWYGKTIAGLKPGSPIPATTTVWIRPE